MRDSIAGPFNFAKATLTNKADSAHMIPDEVWDQLLVKGADYRVLTDNLDYGQQGIYCLLLYVLYFTFPDDNQENLYY